jgi:hypothetical protein
VSLTMNTDFALRRIVVGALVTGGIAIAGIGLAAGTAEAQAPYHWCPGESMVFDPRVRDHTGPGPAFNWDMNICHTWYWVKGGQGNIPYKGSLKSSNAWDGEVPPPNSDPGCGTDMFTGIRGNC